MRFDIPIAKKMFNPAFNSLQLPFYTFALILSIPPGSLYQHLALTIILAQKSQAFNENMATLAIWHTLLLQTGAY
jgi:hypothetical protein